MTRLDKRGIALARQIVLSMLADPSNTASRAIKRRELTATALLALAAQVCPEWSALDFARLVSALRETPDCARVAAADRKIPVVPT